jgi:hypothetical protein
MSKNETDAITKTGKPRSRGRLRILIGFLFLLLTVPPVQGEATEKGPGCPEEHAPKRKVRLALRIAEAKNRKEARRYYQSLARRQKLAPARIPALERKEGTADGNVRTGKEVWSGGSARKRTTPRRRE